MTSAQDKAEALGKYKELTYDAAKAWLDEHAKDFWTAEHKDLDYDMCAEMCMEDFGVVTVADDHWIWFLVDEASASLAADEVP